MKKKSNMDDPRVRQKVTGKAFQDIDAFPGMKPYKGTPFVGFDEAHKELKNAAAKGTFACDWGCSLNQQSRGCTRHAQLRGKI